MLLWLKIILSCLDFLLIDICIGTRKIKINISLIFLVGLCFSSKSDVGVVQSDWFNLN
jgi:hypothetical protein